MVRTDAFGDLMPEELLPAESTGDRAAAERKSRARVRLIVDDGERRWAWLARVLERVLPSRGSLEVCVGSFNGKNVAPDFSERTSVRKAALNTSSSNRS